MTASQNADSFFSHCRKSGLHVCVAFLDFIQKSFALYQRPVMLMPKNPIAPLVPSGMQFETSHALSLAIDLKA